MDTNESFRERLWRRWYDRTLLRCHLLGHRWGEDYEMLDGRFARPCDRRCGWTQIPSKSAASQSVPEGVSTRGS